MPDVEEGGAAGGADLPPEPELKGGLLKPVPETTPIERVFMGIAAITVITAIVAMITEGSIIVIVGGVLALLMGPYSYHQQTKLTDIRTLKETSEKVKVEVNRLKDENERLSSNIDELGSTVDDLKETEKTFEAITSMQGASVDEFKKQVEENKKILAKMHTSTRSRIIQNIISTIWAQDQNKDDIIDEEEVESLMRSIEKIGGVDVREEKLKEVLVGKDTDAVIKIVKNLFNEEIADEDRIFLVTAEDE